MTRNGKIARLPYGIREELNRRLRDGQSGPALLKWLNEQPECLEVLDEEFESRPITKQNLSEWKQGGYQEWLRKEEARQRVQVLTEKAADLEKDARGPSIADRVATLLEVELAVAMEQLDELKDPKERWARLKEISRELYRLRREDHHARKLRMAEEQYERREKEAEREKLLKLQETMRDKPLVTSLRGGGDEAWKWTNWEICVRHGLPMPLWWTNPQTAEEWSRLMMPYWREEAEKAKGDGDSSKSKVQSPKSSECGVRNQAPSVQAPSVQRSSKDHPPSADFGARRDPKSTSAMVRRRAKSGRVRPGQTESNQIEAPSVHPPSSDYGATRAPTVQRNPKDQVPMLEASGAIEENEAEKADCANKEISDQIPTDSGMGEMGRMGEMKAGEADTGQQAGSA